MSVSDVSRTMLLELFLLMIACLAAARPSIKSETDAVKVSLPIFTVQGAVSDNSSSVRVFRGIPYAEPPIGELRFRPPVTKRPVPGIIDATKFKEICPIWNQGGASIYTEYITGNTPYTYLKQGEDCLNLNIWTPINATHDSDLTVMIWVHGGGYLTSLAIFLSVLTWLAPEIPAAMLPSLTKKALFSR